MSKPFPPVLDACCGGRSMWFDKADPRGVFVDIRNETLDLSDISSNGGSRIFSVRPDVVADFTALPFPDEIFAVVAFDPPHLKRNGKRSWMGAKYGTLTGDWRGMLTAGFAECFRVLRPGGALIFKWGDGDVPVSEILALTPHRPLFGTRCGKRAGTHWIVFLKEAEARSDFDARLKRLTEAHKGAWPGVTDSGAYVRDLRAGYSHSEAVARNGRRRKGGVS